MGYHGFVEIFPCHRTETKNVVREHFRVSEKIWYGKKLYGSEVLGGSITSSVEILLAHSVEKIRREPFCVPKDFWYGKKFRDMRGVSRFSVKTFCLTLSERIVGEPFCVSNKILVSKIFKQKRVGVRVRIRGWVSRFCRKFFISECRKTSCGKFLVKKRSFWARRNGGGQRFRRQFCLTGPN